MVIKFKPVLEGGIPKKHMHGDAPEPNKKTDMEHIPAFKITDFPQNHLKYHLHKAVAGPRTARNHNVVHASDLDPSRNWCPREPALLTLHKKKRPDGFISTAQKTVFDFGYAGADIVIRALPPEMVWGNWRCRSCRGETKHCYTPKKCGHCGADRKLLRYQEVFLRDPETEIVGSVDLIVDLLGSGKKIPIEIKTEGNETFKARTKEVFEHGWRTNLYLWLIERTPWMQGEGVSSQEGRVLYVAKEGFIPDTEIKKWKLPDWHKTPFKEYTIKRNDDFTQNARDDAFDYRFWKNAHTKGDFGVDLPPRKCGAKNDTQAKNCAVCKECWEIK